VVNRQFVCLLLALRSWTASLNLSSRSYLIYMVESEGKCTICDSVLMVAAFSCACVWVATHRQDASAVLQPLCTYESPVWICRGAASCLWLGCQYICSARFVLVRWSSGLALPGTLRWGV
jgi:hypothetical protein